MAEAFEALENTGVLHGSTGSNGCARRVLTYWATMVALANVRMSNAYAFTVRRRPPDRPFQAKRGFPRRRGTSSRKKNRAPAGNSNLATTAALIVRRSAFKPEKPSGRFHKWEAAEAGGVSFQRPED